MLSSHLNLTCVTGSTEKDRTNTLQFIVQYLKVNGNHETMNVEGDFRDVDTRAFDECTDFFTTWRTMHKTGTKLLRTGFLSQGSGNKLEFSNQRINREVSIWIKSSSDNEDSPEMPLIATLGYDSVVWSRLYSRETSDQDDYQIEHAS